MCFIYYFVIYALLMDQRSFFVLITIKLVINKEEKKMTKLNEKTVAAINKIILKGDHIVVSGTTESGKSTAIGFFAKSDAVRGLMSMREAKGKGSTIETHIVVTDYKEIPEDEMIIRANVPESHIATCGDDNELLGKVLYTAVRKSDGNCSEDSYAEQIRNAFFSELKEPSNESLAYKLNNVSNEELEMIVERIKAFDCKTMLLHLTEAKAKFEERGYSPKSRSSVEPRIFKELLAEKKEYSDKLNAFWNCIIEVLNNQASALLNKLEDAGAEISSERDGFTISLDDEDYDTEIANILLRSEDSSMEYLFSDMFIIFRGNESIYSGPYNKFITVSEENGEEIHCLSIVDSMGLFHSASATAEEEAERVIDLIAKNHSTKLLLVVNSHITDTVKDGYDAIRGMLAKLNREVEIYILYTHWDEYLSDEVKDMKSSNRRGRTTMHIDWASIYASAEAKQTELTKSFSESITASGKARPILVGTYKAALVLGEGTSKEEVLATNNVDYDMAIEAIVKDLLMSINRKGPKFRVKGGMVEGCSIVPEARLFDVKKLYRNMVVDCKGRRYWPATVRAVNTKWRCYGDKHVSDIKENYYGFVNIRSEFVEDMRNFAMGILNNTNSVKIDLSEYVVDTNQVNEIEDLVLQYLKIGQTFGKEFAKIIGSNAFEKGFKKNPGFCYQYERLTDMLQYTQEAFFKGEQIRIDSPEAGYVIECLQAALEKCVTEFINAKCIEVY